MAEWTPATLKEYADRRFEGIERAVDKADEATTRRFESINELRGALSDAQSKFLTKGEYEHSHVPIEGRVTTIEVSQKDLLSRSEFQAYLIRQEDNAAQVRRAQLQVVVSVGLAIFSLIVSLLGAIGHL